jgi:hypothetical protein
VEWHQADLNLDGRPDYFLVLERRCDERALVLVLVRVEVDQRDCVDQAKRRLEENGCAASHPPPVPGICRVSHLFVLT